MPVDDTAKTCADEAVTVDVLANDTDPENDPLTITAVNGQAISEGGSVEINVDGDADVITVTLSGGALVVDGSAEFADLTIGSEAAVSFSYTVSDGANTADANVDMTFCGAKNTLETIEASLPAGEICFQLIDENNPSPLSDEVWTMKISGSGDARLDGLVIDEAYCLAAYADVTAGLGGTDIDLAPVLKGNIYLADADSIPAGALDNPVSGGVGVNGEAAVDNLDLVNWILNQDFNGQGYTDGEIQGAIWGLMDNIVFIADGGGDVADAQEIVDLAIANGEGFEAAEGDIIGLFIDPTTDTETAGHNQPFIVGVEWTQLEEDCIC